MRTRLSCLWLMVALCLHTGLAQQCDDGYELFPAYPGSRYKLPPVKLSWLDAFYLCESDGGNAHLAIVNSAEEAEVVKTLVNRVASSQPYAWVGMNDIFQEGQWVTVQGGLVSGSGFDDWAPDRPNVDSTSNCGHMYTDGLYYDGVCSVLAQFVCEKPNA